MIRLSKLADYATVLLCYMANHDKEEGKGCVITVKQLSEASGLPLATVGKLLKVLCRHDIVFSIRGSQGGYGLKKQASEISVAAIVEAVDGPVAITQCSVKQGVADCHLHLNCPVRPQWQQINRVVIEALGQLSLQMLLPHDKNNAVFTPKKSLQASFREDLVQVGQKALRKDRPSQQRANKDGKEGTSYGSFGA